MFLGFFYYAWRMNNISKTRSTFEVYYTLLAEKHTNIKMAKYLEGRINDEQAILAYYIYEKWARALCLPINSREIRNSIRKILVSNPARTEEYFDGILDDVYSEITIKKIIGVYDFLKNYLIELDAVSYENRESDQTCESDTDNTKTTRELLNELEELPNQSKLNRAN